MKEWPCTKCEYNTGLMMACRGQYCDEIMKYNEIQKQKQREYSINSSINKDVCENL